VRGDRVGVANRLHQRCLVHVCRNLIAKVPTHAQGEVKADYWQVLDQIEHDGEAAVAEGRRRAKRFIASWKPLSPPRSGGSPTTSTRSWSTCASPASTASASATPT
jgi:transposase-like protein